MPEPAYLSKRRTNALIEDILEAKVLEGSYLTNSSSGLDGLFTNSSLTGSPHEGEGTLSVVLCSSLTI